MNQYRIPDNRLSHTWQSMTKAERASAWRNFYTMLDGFKRSMGSQAVHRERREKAKQNATQT